MRCRLVAGALLGVLAALGGALAPPAGAVVGGRPADPGEWPWQVALLVDGAIACGGSLVAADLVLTAAHCTEDALPSDFEVVAGTVDLRKGGQRRRVATVEEHEDYDPEALTSDLALLELDRPFRLGEDVVPVTIASRDESAIAAQDGKPAIVTGFGERAESGETSDVLLEGEIDAYADARCERLYREDGDDVDGEVQVCAGRSRGHVDACFGDSGGPLVAPVGDGGWRQIGIVSWGSGCGVPDRPTVYTEVAAFAPWLAERGVGQDVVRVDGEGARVPARGTVGKASRYPLTVVVEEFAGVVRAVSVELVGLRHGRPSDLDIWLVGPDGTTVAVLSDVGGSDDLDALDVLVVDGVEPASRSRLPGVVGPSDREVDRQRRGPALADGLAAFTGIDPTGTWQLLVADDRPGATGSLDGWSLELR